MLRFSLAIQRMLHESESRAITGGFLPLSASCSFNVDSPFDLVEMKLVYVDLKRTYKIDRGCYPRIMTPTDSRLVRYEV
jgi:hypothetical protein